jgi:hypothetical protein
MVLDSEQYTEPQCAGSVKGDLSLDGLGTGLVLENIGQAMTTNKTTYYTTTVRSRSNTQTVAGVLAFRDANTFCLLENRPNPVGSEIDQYVQSIDLNATQGLCWKKSSIQRFQRQAPTTVVSTSKALLADVQPSLQKLQNQLEVQANAGYRLNWANFDTRTDSPTASFELHGDARDDRNLYTKDEAANASKYQYTVLDGAGSTAAERYALWKTQLTQQASLGFLYKQQAIVKLADNKPSLYNNIFEKRVGDTANYAITTKEVARSAVKDKSTWEAVANELGSQGCRIFFAEYIYDSQFSFACSNSNLHDGTYQYRWIESASNAKATDVQAILDAQKAEGFVYRFELELPNGQVGFVFEKDSTQPNLAASIQYKVFNDSVLDSGDSTSLMDERITHQGLLGWHLLDGRSVLKEGSILTSSNIKTIFVNRPLP